MLSSIGAFTRSEPRHLLVILLSEALSTTLLGGTSLLDFHDSRLDFLRELKILLLLAIQLLNTPAQVICIRDRSPITRLAGLVKSFLWISLMLSQGLSSSIDCLLIRCYVVTTILPDLIVRILTKHRCLIHFTLYEISNSTRNLGSSLHSELGSELCRLHTQFKKFLPIQLIILDEQSSMLLDELPWAEEGPPAALTSSRLQHRKPCSQEQVGCNLEGPHAFITISINIHNSGPLLWYSWPPSALSAHGDDALLVILLLVHIVKNELLQLHIQIGALRKV